MLDFMVADLVHDGRLVEILGDFSSPGPPIHAVTAPGRSRSANVRAIIDFASAMFGGQRGNAPAAPISPGPSRT